MEKKKYILNESTDLISKRFEYEIILFDSKFFTFFFHLIEYNVISVLNFSVDTILRIIKNK